MMYLAGSWASSEDRSQSGPSESRCKVLDDAEDDPEESSGGE
jgi:hypothetical protein